MATVPALIDRTPAQRWAEIRDEDASGVTCAPSCSRP